MSAQPEVPEASQLESPAASYAATSTSTRITMPVEEETSPTTDIKQSSEPAEQSDPKGKAQGR